MPPQLIGHQRRCKGLAGLTCDAIAGGCERDTQRGPTSPVVALDHNVAATEPTNTSQRYYLTALLSSAASPAVPPSPRRPRVITGCGVAALGGRREEGAESRAPDGGVFAAACALGRGLMPEFAFSSAAHNSCRPPSPGPRACNGAVARSDLPGLRNG